MKLIKPSFTIIEQGPGIECIYKQIEIAGRTCYRSENKITETSAKDFVDRMVKSGHGAMLEHGTVYLTFHVKDPSIIGKEEYNNQQAELNTLIQKYANNKYSIVKVNHYHDTAFITTNYRVLIENNWVNDLKYLCEPTVFHEKRICVKFICDRGVTHEFVRHRVFSFAQESTRYCNYSKDKFGNELTFIIPCWVDKSILKEAEETVTNNDNYKNLIREYYYRFSAKQEEWFKSKSVAPEINFIIDLQTTEQLYLDLINRGWTAQEARTILPNAVKTELVMTGFVKDWEHFFHLRCASSAHPQARELAQPLEQEFINRKYLCGTK